MYVCQDGWILGVFFFAWLYGLREVKVQEQKRMKPMASHLDQKGLFKKDLFTLFLLKLTLQGFLSNEHNIFFIFLCGEATTSCKNVETIR